MNKPYKREGGIKITKEIPYVNQYPNRSKRRQKLNRKFNNKKGTQLVVSYFGRGKFSKVEKRLNYLKDRCIVQYKVK